MQNNSGPASTRLQQENQLHRVVTGSGDIEEVPEASSRAWASQDIVKRSAVWGACAGFVIGLIPLFAWTVLGAGAGAMIAKASQLRVEPGSAPRIHFVKDGR